MTLVYSFHDTALRDAREYLTQHCIAWRTHGIVLNHVHVCTFAWLTRFCILGEIEETPQDEVEDEQAVTSQIAYLRMQLEEKRRHIEAEKHRVQTEWEDQRRRLGQTAFWYVIGKAQGGQNPGEGTGSEVRSLA